MTTNVTVVRNIIACDSRWSIDRSHDGDVWKFAIYVDDAQFGKIAVLDKKAAFIFAGCGIEIQAWKDWIAGGATASRPEPNELAVCIVNATSGDLIFEHGQIVSNDAIKIAGSGASFAYSCYEDNSCAVKAITSAKNKDCFSGGSVKYLDVANGINEVSDDSIRIEQVSELIAREGMVVLKNHHDLERCNGSKAEPVPVLLAAANDPEIAAAVSSIIAGKASARAPFNSEKHVWTKDKLNALDDAIEMIRSM